MNAFKKMLLITTFAATFGAATGAHASLIGNTVTATGLTLGPATAVVNSGIEFSGIANYIKFDFGARARRQLSVFKLARLLLLQDGWQQENYERSCHSGLRWLGTA
jgi:hypothetical protein